MNPLFWCLLFALGVIAALLFALVAAMDQGAGVRPTRRQRRAWNRERADLRSVRR